MDDPDNKCAICGKPVNIDPATCCKCCEQFCSDHLNNDGVCDNCSAPVIRINRGPLTREDVTANDGHMMLAYL